MTPCEKLGYKVGDKFVVVVSDYGSFRVGDVVLLEEDDGTSCPLFTDNHGHTHFMYLDQEVKPYVEPRSSQKKLTPFEAAGYTKEDKFEIIGNTKTCHNFDIGTIVVLSEDDNSDAPLFQNVEDEEADHFVHLKDIRKLNVSEENNMISSLQLERSEIVIPCPEGYVFDGIRKLNKGDFRLVLDGMEVEEWTQNYSSCAEYIVLKKKQPETLEGYVEVPAKFERVPGLTIENGLYWTDEYNDNPIEWDLGKHAFHDDEDNTKIWKRVN